MEGQRYGTRIARMHTDTIDPFFVFNQKGEKKINTELGRTQNELTLPEFVSVRFSSLLISSYLIKTGESTTIEFKEKFDERCIESAVAFASPKGRCFKKVDSSIRKKIECFQIQ